LLVLEMLNPFLYRVAPLGASVESVDREADPATLQTHPNTSSRKTYHGMLLSILLVVVSMPG
jgi:hypothetical protein